MLTPVPYIIAWNLAELFRTPQGFWLVMEACRSQRGCVGAAGICLHQQNWALWIHSRWTPKCWRNTRRFNHIQNLSLLLAHPGHEDVFLCMWLHVCTVCSSANVLCSKFCRSVNPLEKKKKIYIFFTLIPLKSIFLHSPFPAWNIYIPTAQDLGTWQALIFILCTFILFPEVTSGSARGELARLNWRGGFAGGKLLPARWAIYLGPTCYSLFKIRI